MPFLFIFFFFLFCFVSSRVYDGDVTYHYAALPEIRRVSDEKELRAAGQPRARPSKNARLHARSRSPARARAFSSLSPRPGAV